MRALKTLRPNNLHIIVRKLYFEYQDVLHRNRYWNNNDPVASHFMDALQASFPEGERFFIEAAADGVKLLEEGGLMDPRLREDFKLFSQQEAFHGIQHTKWTQALINEGYRALGPYMTVMREFREQARGRVSVKSRLAFTAAAEHYTASLAYFFGKIDTKSLTRAKFPFKNLLLYHAMEELEHKGVCYDIFQCVSGNYLRRLLGFIVLSRNLIRGTYRRFRWLLEKDHLWDKDHRRTIRNYFLGWKGLVWGILPRILLYLKPNFHPWQTDDRLMLEQNYGKFREESGIPPFQYI